MSKPKAIVEFEKLTEDIKQRIKLNYPNGFEKHLIQFKNHKKHLISALPYETIDKHYLVKMTREKANTIILEDDDYNENGILRNDKIEEYKKKFDKADAKAAKKAEKEAEATKVKAKAKAKK